MANRRRLADAIKVAALCLPPVLIAVSGLARMATAAMPRPPRCGPLAARKRNRPRICDRSHRT
jgi:hypothetical protein